METGTYISGLGHVAVLGWAMIGGVLTEQPQESEFLVTDVSVISEAAFAALVSDAPVPETSVTLPELPENALNAPDAPAADDQPRLTSLAEPDDPQDPGDRPDLSNVTEPAGADALVETPDLTAPETTDSPGVTLITPTDPISNRDSAGLKQPDQLAMLETEQPPAPRVDTTPAPEPDTEAETANETEHATTPDPNATIPAEETVEQAPDQASTEIITEANESESLSAPVRSSRPKGRPAGLAKEANTSSQIARALAEAQAEAAASATRVDPSPTEPSGPPLSEREKDGLRLAVQKCWNVGSLSSDALRVTVTVGVALDNAGKILSGSIHLISSTDGSNAAAKQAYEAARRAIIRCGAKGFDLPQEKYDHWREIEMTFNPEKMRIR